MILFINLILAHMIADFMLQFEELYRLKVKSKLGHFLHVFIHLTVSLLVSIPFLYHPLTWIFITALSFIHYGQDIIKYRLQKNEKIMFWCFTIDQIIHFFIITSVLILPISRLEPHNVNIPFLKHFVKTPEISLVVIEFIAASFGGTYFLHALRKSYCKNTRPDHFITSFEMTHAMIERGLIAYAWTFGNLFFIAFSPLIGLIRLSDKRLRSKFDFFLSYLLSATLGIIFYYIFNRFDKGI